MKLFDKLDDFLHRLFRLGVDMKSVQGTKDSCTCEVCVNACYYKPGWFRPGQVEDVAVHLGLTLQELFDQKLTVDWFNDEEGLIYVLSPAIKEGRSGEEHPMNPRGTCTFLTEDNRCSIHGVKPFECREYWHDSDPDSFNTEDDPHVQVALSWLGHQDQIEQLLGRKPNHLRPELISAIVKMGDSDLTETLRQQIEAYPEGHEDLLEYFLRQLEKHQATTEG